MRRVVLLLFVLFICIAQNEIDAAKILVVFPPPAASHHSLGKRIVNELLERGHHVTFISSFEEKKPHANYTDIVLTGYIKETEDMKKTIYSIMGNNGLDQFFHMIKMVSAMTNKTLAHENVQRLMNDKNAHFDLIIIEAFMNEAHLGLAHYFKAPSIVISPIGPNVWINSLVMNPMPTAYVPDILTGYSSRMTFFERLTNTIMANMIQLVYDYKLLPIQDEILHLYFPDAPSIYDMMHSVSLVLTNSHPSFGTAKPLVPNMIEIGGFHLNEPKPLPNDLKQYLDEAKQGFILFSLGSNFQSIMMPDQMRNDIMKVLAQLPYKVLWKFENDTLPNKPDNVRIKKWLPQTDILAHPNIKLFITHGGLLSTTESVYFGVPVVGLPIFGDQNTNMATAEKLGFGVSLPLTQITYEGLLNAVNEVISNDKYRLNARHRSRLLRDQPLRPIDAAMYWIEYVIRNKNVDHLRTGAIDLNFYQLALLDVYGFLFAVLFLIIFIPIFLIKKLCCRKKTSIKKDGKKKNQ